MKKFYALAAALILFAQGAGKSVPLSASLIDRLEANQRLTNAFKDGTGTPENSVLVYGRISTLTEMVFYQMDSNFERDIQTVNFILDTEDSVFCLAPVAPSSYYMTGHTVSEDNKPFVGIIKTWNFASLQGSFWDFRAPSKPGLYYYGSYDFPESEEKGERVAFENQKKEELKCLKLLAKHLKRTSWSDVIQKRIAELEGESK